MHACVCACMCVHVWISSILRVKRNKFELIQHQSSPSSDKFNSIIEKYWIWTLYGLKVPVLQVSSIPWLNKGKFELIQHFGLLQLLISYSSFGVLRHMNLTGIDCIIYFRIHFRSVQLKVVLIHPGKLIHALPPIFQKCPWCCSTYLWSLFLLYTEQGSCSDAVHTVCSHPLPTIRCCRCSGLRVTCQNNYGYANLSPVQRWQHAGSHIQVSATAWSVCSC